MSRATNSTPLRLGVIGMSEGNGHPYSWSAICNGYDPEAMADCPFPAIPDYLAKQRFPADALPGARVTHIWTQERRVSEHVARASLIPNIVDRLESMLGQVDGVLLARDDAGKHLEHAQVFLRAGIPIYIDKPLGLSRAAALNLFSLAQYSGQLFSCTALRYARELELTNAGREQVGELRFVDAVVPKAWDTYAVHVIEPVLAFLPAADRIRSHHRVVDNGVTQLSVSWTGGVQTRFTSTGTAGAPITINIYGARGALHLKFQDSFSAFKAALAHFVAGMDSKQPVIAEETTLKVIDLIELGRT